MILRSAILVLLLVASASGGWCASVAEVKATARNWMQVTVEGIITYTEPSECYIQSPDRSGGIWVHAAMDGFEVGDPVLAVGTFAVVDGEPAVTNAAITPHGTPSEIRPFGMSNRAVGGASKWSPMFISDFRRGQWVNASGANNTGLLVTMWGTVKSVCYSPITGASWLYVDDGSGVVSDYGDTGVLVYADTQANIGDFVSVTGVSSTERSLDDPSRLVRVVRTRTTEDLRVEQAAQLPEIPTGPFSDEFDRPQLDPRWLGFIGAEYGSSASLSAEPGWLAVAVSATRSYDWAPVLMQDAQGDWDLLVRMRGPTGGVPRGQAGVRLFSSSDVYRPYYTAGQPIAELYYVNTAPSGWRVKLGSSAAWTAWGDTCVFRIRKRQNTIYVSASPDGAGFGQETVLGNRDCRYLGALMYYVISSGDLTSDRFTACFDYFRVSEPAD